MRKPLTLFPILALSPLLLLTPAAFAQPVSHPAPPAWVKQRVRTHLGQTVADREINTSVLAGVAFFPDEVIAAILEVAQDPEPLMAGTVSGDADWQAAYTLLSADPMVLESMRTHPVATRLIGEAAKRDLNATWAAIDHFRAAYRAQTGMAVAQALIAEETPSTAAVDAEEDSDSPASVIVDFSSTVSETVVEIPQTEADSGSAYPYPLPVTGGVVVVGSVEAPVVTSGAVSVYGYNATAPSQGGAVVAVNGQGQAVAGGAAGAVVETPNGTAVVGGAGYAAIDTDQGTAHTQATVGGINENGQGAIAHREADTRWTENSAARSVEGQVQTTGGNGAEWSRDQSFQQTDEGYSAQSSGSIEGNSGASASYDRSVEMSEEGLDVDRSGSATNAQGENVEWGNQEGQKVLAPTDSAVRFEQGQREAAAKMRADSQPSATSNAQNPRTAGARSGSSGSTSRSAASGVPSPSGQGFSGKVKDNPAGWNSLQAGPGGPGAAQFARPQGMPSREAFSAKDLSSKQRAQAMSRAQSQQNHSLQAMNARPKGSSGPIGLNAPQNTGGRQLQSPSRGTGPKRSTGGHGGASRAGGGGGRRR